MQVSHLFSSCHHFINDSDTDENFGGANRGAGAIRAHAKRAESTCIRHADMNQGDVRHDSLLVEQPRRLVQEYRDAVRPSLVYRLPEICIHVQADGSEVLFNVTSSQAIIFHNRT